MKSQKTHAKCTKQNLSSRAKKSLSLNPSDHQFRLFIDPASYSTGWALFEGSKRRISGTIRAPKKLAIASRMATIEGEYWELGNNLTALKEPIDVIMEMIPGRCHYYVQWSIGAILAGLFAWPCFIFKARISPKSWQKTVDWKGKRATLKGYKVDSEDELAAIGMGLHFLQGGKVSYE